jgi:hypothetical protein
MKGRYYSNCLLEKPLRLVKTASGALLFHIGMPFRSNRKQSFQLATEPRWAGRWRARPERRRQPGYSFGSVMPTWAWYFPLRSA